MRITRVLVLAATVGVAVTVWDFVSDQARTETKERAIPDAGREALNQPPKASFPSFRQNGAPMSSRAAKPPQSPAEVGKVVEGTRALFDRTTAYLAEGRPDLARRTFQRLKAQRESLPDFLQIQVDRLEVLLQTDGPLGPQRALRAAILANSKH